MKKFLLTTTMLVGFVAIAQAQQGRVGINTTTPAATLDVVANTTDATRPDAVLVPRMTATELNAKNAAYVAAQNGALVFVTSGTGVAATKTANVTGTGFYYYDNATSLWVAVGGGGASTQRYEAIRGTTVTTTAATYVPVANDYFIITNSAGGTTVNFPNLTAADAGRVIWVFNNNTAANANTINNVSGITTMTQFRGYGVVWSGTNWFSLTK